MNKILTSVEITKDNAASDYLRFKYNDNSYQEYRITTGKPKTCTTYGGELDKGERKICKDDRVYYLIENDEQISVRCNFTEDCNNFICCIFLIDAYFHGKNFSDAMFDRAIFNEGVNFSHVTFNDKVSFTNAQFIKSAVFTMAEFNKETNFNHARFNKNVAFSGAEFNGEVNSVETIFNGSVDFDTITTTITTTGSSSKTTTTPPSFSKKVDFTRAIFNHVLNFSGVESINLDLEHAIIDRIEYGNTKFSADKRETFLTLKNVALKQHDQIKALEFHTQEYQSHYEKLNWNNADKWILGFENSVSYFGTNAGRAIGWLAFLIVFFYFFIFMLLGGGDANMHDFVRFTAPISYDLTTIFRNKITVGFFVGLLFILYKILQFVMIYEVVKSFRKFSRTL
ncbi:hypothetical protein BSPCLSOX_2300 [uncultured Gammaproteobacteria bacterium]|nr:hypothetical protein BSPCLSOX_2300 [uncultured Gammaproteobacteria bacterium]